MGLRVRKTIKAGPFRATVSKSGISYSAGVKGARVTKRADGRVQGTVSSHGVSYTATGKQTPKVAPARRSAARAPQPVKPSKPARAARAARPPRPLPGTRSTIMPRPPWGWTSPRVFKGAGLGFVSVGEWGVQLNVKKEPVAIPWQAITAVDFLEPRFARMGHVHFVTAGDPRGLDVFARDGNPLTAIGKNLHAIQFPKGRRAAFDELRRFIGG